MLSFDRSAKILASYGLEAIVLALPGLDNKILASALD